MEGERWRKIEDLFHLALAQPAEDRESFLASQCEETQLRLQVASLLEGEEEADARIEAAFRDTFRLAARTTPAPTEREAIGPYRLLRPLGRGGLGTVFLAERADDQYSLQVAIKLIRRGLDTDDILQRFRLERQILASLAHPNIARFLDGGSTKDGLPYLVMEYVEGEPIDRYCARQRLDLRQRLRLFQRVSEAVAFAHRSLVIHRDLKPSNLLVTRDGEPKLLDFGIAKLLDPGRFTLGASPTMEGLQRLTPEFASPEQWTGDPVSTASDIYSLGVLLHLLLTGELPHARPGMTPRQIEARVTTTMPTAPSKVVAGLPPEAVPAGLDRRLSRQLAGDLDNIVGMALQREPERRYASARQLAQDVRNHLRGLPVQARPDTWTYRVSKFVRRHRVAVTAGAVALAMVVGAAFFHTVRLRDERDRAQEAFRRSEAVRGFLIRLFDAFDPELASPDPSAREILTAGLEHLDAELAEQPAIRAELGDLVGTLLQELGRYQEALPLLTNSLRLQRQLHPGDAPGVAASLDHLGDLLIDLGDWRKADTLYRQSLAMRRRLWGERHPEVAKSLNDLGVAAYYLRDYQRSRAAFEQALSLRQELFGADHLEVAETLSDLGALSHRLGDFEAAKSHLARALEIRRSILGSDHLEVALSLNNLAALPGIEGAEAMVHQALAIHRHRLGANHLQVALDLNNLAAIRKEQGDAPGAEELYAEALEITRRSGGPNHPNLPMLLTRLARLQVEDGRHGQAEAAYEEALRIQRQLPAQGSWRLSNAMANLAEFLLSRERPNEAEPLLQQAVALSRKARPEHWRTTWAESLWGHCLDRLGRHDDARPLLEKAHNYFAAQRPDSSQAQQTHEWWLAAHRETANQSLH